MHEDYSATQFALLLNTAEGRVQFVVQNACTHAFLVGQEWHAPTAGVEVLVPAVEQAFSMYQIQPCQISRVACVAGPGSFTGLRLALTTASGIARGTGAQQAGLSYLHLLATSFAITHPNACEAWAIIHARNNSVVFQQFSIPSTHAYRHSSGQLETDSYESLQGIMQAVPVPTPVQAVLVGTPEQAMEHICASTAPEKYILGSGVVRNLAQLQDFLHKNYSAEQQAQCIFLGSHYSAPSLRALALLGATAEYADADVDAIYVRPCDAVDNLPHIAEKMGRDVEATLAALQTVATIRIE